MRWMLYIVGSLVALVLVAVIVLLLIGGGRGEGQHRASIEIERSPAVVFPWLSEPARQKAWVGWLVDIRSAQTAGPGAPARDVWVMEDRNNNGQRMEVLVEVTRADAPRRLEAALQAPGAFAGTETYALDEIAPGRTRLTHTATFRYDHWLAKLLEPVITRSAQGKLEEDLARLKQRVEAEAP